MKPISIRVLAFEDAAGGWIAQCVDYDIVVRSQHLLQLPKRLAREVKANIHINEQLGRIGLDGIPPAPDRFRAAFEAARDRFIPEADAIGAGVEIDEFRLVKALAA